eukprot:UN12746
MPIYYYEILVNNNIDTFFACDIDFSKKRHLEEDIFEDRQIHEMNLITLSEVTDDFIKKEMLMIRSCIPPV